MIALSSLLVAQLLEVMVRLALLARQLLRQLQQELAQQLLKVLRRGGKLEVREEREEKVALERSLSLRREPSRLKCFNEHSYPQRRQRVGEK